MTSSPSPVSPRSPRGPGFLALVLGITLGIARDQRMRRSALFVITLAAMGLLFIGAVLIDDWLSKRPWIFLLYWAACLWFTLATLLLALYDLLMVRKMAAEERKHLAQQMKADIRSELAQKPHDPDQRKP